MDNDLEKAFELRKNLEYQKAIDIYQSLWQQNPNQFDDWAGWSYAFCLSKLNRHQEALDICRILFVRFKSSEVLNSLYGQCVYYTQFRTKQLPNADTLKKACNAIYQLSPPDSRFSFAPRAIFKLIKVLMAANNVDWKEIQSWLEKFDPDVLEDASFSMIGQNGKRVEYASPREEWYSAMIKTKAGLNQPRDLLELLNAARARNLKWHYDNDIWFARKEAYAWQQLGDKEKAEAILRKILLRKKDWYLIFDLAQVVADEQEALSLLCSAALAPGKNEMKLKLFETLFNKLKSNDNFQREAGLHLCLVTSMRVENEWPVRQEMQIELQQRNIDTVREGASGQVYHHLVPFWKMWAGGQVPKRQEGVIIRVLPNGESGFVKSANQSFYASFREIKKDLKINMKVTFELIDTIDRKKNKPSKMAIKIKQL